jgi:hypothetical protein
MRRVLLTIVLCAAVIGTGATSATAQRRSVVEHVSLKSEPFALDLTDPSGSAQCDVQAVGYDTGVLNIITIFDSNGVPSRSVSIQSLSTTLTNPENGKVLELRAANVTTNSYTFNADGSLTIVAGFSGLNVLNKGETRFVSAGHQRSTFLLRFDEAGNLTSVDVVDDFRTPKLAHAYPFFCAMLT